MLKVTPYKLVMLKDITHTNYIDSLCNTKWLCFHIITGNIVINSPKTEHVTYFCTKH